MDNRALSPSAVNNYLKTILEKDKYLSSFKIKGEISNLKYHSNGNMYFSVKDAQAAINCIMFKSYATKLEQKFSEGDEVEIDGSLYLYVKMGQYNINVRAMKRAGVGNLFALYEELKKDYELKGYFDSVHKQQIPKFPQTIGIVTAQTGAAIKDIMTTLERRFKLAKIVVYPALVQGANAKFDVANKIKLANIDKRCDVLIVGRGGGSIEDLWAFNEKEVIEAVWASKIPIISSVGHETDTVLCDYVADCRAPTPTAAAELASPDSKELDSQLLNYKQIAKSQLKTKFNSAKLKLKLIEQDQYFINPLLNYEMQQQELYNQLNVIKQSHLNKVMTSELNINNCKKQLQEYDLQMVYKPKIDFARQSLQLAKQDLINKVNTQSNNLDHQKQLIDNLNPLTILSKGYSVSMLGSKIIKNSSDITVGDELLIKYQDGNIKTIVTEKEPNG